MFRNEIEKTQVCLIVNVVFIPEVYHKDIRIYKYYGLLRVQAIASFAPLNFGPVIFNVFSMSFHASSNGLKEDFSNESAVTGDIKAKGFPLKVTTTFSPLETASIASPVLFLRFPAVIVFITISSSNSYFGFIVAIYVSLNNHFIVPRLPAETPAAPGALRGESV